MHVWPPAMLDKAAHQSVYRMDSSDPHSELVQRAHLDAEDVEQISALMAALGRLRDAERQLAKASQRYMKLNETDMRALHFLIVAENRGEIVTPSAIAGYLGISAASTTKLLDRLEDGGHITRHLHPSDRRALSIRISAQTRASAMNSVGKQQARRFHSAAALTREERSTVIGFLERMTNDLLDGATDIPPGNADETVDPASSPS